MVGNRSVGALLGRQANVAVGPPADAWEREADRVAGAVMRRLPAVPSTAAAPAEARDAAAGRPLDPGMQRAMGEILGADFGGVRVHTGPDADLVSGALRARAFTVGQDVYFHGSAYDPRTPGGQELIAHELTHVVQQNGGRVRRASPPEGSDAEPAAAVAVSSAPAGRAQRRFGFEIELPMLFTKEDDFTVKSLADGSDIDLQDVPIDAGTGGPKTHLVDSTECYLNVDHSRTLNELFRAHLAQYATDHNFGPASNTRASLLAAANRLMPQKTSIVEVVTEAWDESTLSRDQALAKVRSVIDDITALYDGIDGDRKREIDNNYFVGSDAPHSDLFQPRLGYFHATYGVKLAQVPALFEQTTQQRRNLAEYAKGGDPAEKPHAQNVELTSRAVTVGRSALKKIKKAWPRVAVTHRYRPNTSEVDLSDAAERDFLGFLTLLSNYFLLMGSGTGGDADLAKQAVGMHYYKSDLYDVANSLPAEVTGPLRDAANTTVVDHVVDSICAAVGVDRFERFGGLLGGYSIRGYLYQILRGHYGVITTTNPAGNAVPKRDASGQTFRDPVLAYSINPWSSKLGPDQLGPPGNRSTGVVVENRHLEYLDPNYGALATAWDTKFKTESRMFAPKADPDTRSPLEKAMYESIGARESGPARKPIGQWESLMMGIYDMVKALNAG